MNRIFKSLLIYVLIAVLMIFAIASLATRTEQPQELAYSDLIDRIEDGSIRQVTFIGESYAPGT